MRNEPNLSIERYRQTHPVLGAGPVGTNTGFFIYCGLAIISNSEFMGWEHVSVSVINEKRTPTWGEMDAVKDLFWNENELVVQYHVPAKDKVNIHPYCLHL